MNRNQSTRLWGVATWWSAASISMASCAANYAAMMNHFMTKGRKPQERKSAATLIDAKPAPQAAVQIDVAAQPAVVQKATPKLLVPHEIETQDLPLPEPASAPITGEMKEFVAQPMSQGKSGKKRKNRPEHKGSGAQQLPAK